MKYWCCCCLTWTQLSWDHSWWIGNVKFNINYSLILCRVSQHEPRHVLSYAKYIFIPIQMTSPFCLHFIHVLFFEILLPICRSSLLISYCLLKQLVMRICIFVLSNIFSPYFSLSGKMPSSIKTNIKSASGSMHPYNRWAPFLKFIPSFIICFISETHLRKQHLQPLWSFTWSHYFHGIAQLLRSYFSALNLFHRHSCFPLHDLKQKVEIFVSGYMFSFWIKHLSFSVWATRWQCVIIHGIITASTLNYSLIVFQ